MSFDQVIVPSSVSPATLLTPAADLFAVRAARLRHLAGGHSMAPWLNWLAGLCDAQQQQLAGMPDLGLPAGGAVEPDQRRLGVDHPALNRAWPAVYATLRTSLGGQPGSPVLPELSPAALATCATQAFGVAAGHAPMGERSLADFLMAAALQVTWTAAARQLALPEVQTLGDGDLCPCCGSAPVGAIVMAGEGKAGLRYLECSLCATRWNAVRARCTLCDDGSLVNYLAIEGGSEAVKAECCDHCHGYIKTFFQDKDRQVDPQADDLASLALDVLVGEQGYARACPNLFLAEGEAA